MPPDLTPQEANWCGPNGLSYAKTYLLSPAALDRKWIKRIDMSRTDIFRRLMADVPKGAEILEVGCNVGNQLELLRTLGYTNLRGIEICDAAVKRARDERGLTVVQGNARALPWKPGTFDLVFTCWVIGHVSPVVLPRALSEIHRVSRRWILCTEPWSEGGIREARKRHMWAADFAEMFTKQFPDLRVVQRIKHPRQWGGAASESFLLEKVACSAQP